MALCPWKSENIICIYSEEIEKELRKGNLPMYTVCKNCEVKNDKIR